MNICRKYLLGCVILFLGFFAALYVYNYVPLRTAIFRNFAKGTIYMMSESDTLYVFGYAGVEKYLVSNPESPVLLAKNNQMCKNCFIGHLIPRSGAINDNYLYVACRSYLGGPDFLTDESYIDGKMLVIQKSNLSIVNEYRSDIKLIETKVKDTLLVVSGLYGFDMYNIKNPKELKEIYKYRQKNFTEFQGVDFIEKDSMRMVVFCRFAEGISIWDISNFQKVHSIYDFHFSDTLSSGQLLDGNLQSFNLIYNAPYIYATVAPTKGDFGKERDNRGILTIDVSNMNDIRTSYTAIPKDIFYSTLIGDPEPSYISRYGNKLYTNFGEKGVAVFNIEELGTPKFEKIISVGNNGSMILPLHINNNGILFTGDYYWNNIYSYKIK